MLLKKSLTKFLITSVAIIALLILSGVAFAQTDTGKISGFVKDQNGAIVPGANITVTNQRNGDERSAKANDDGFYSVPALKASSYRIFTCKHRAQSTVVRVRMEIFASQAARSNRTKFATTASKGPRSSTPRRAI